MAIKVVIAKAHQVQLSDTEIQKEIFSVEEELNKSELTFKENAVNYVFIKGIYLHQERKMITVCLLVNKTGKMISELHGELRMRFSSKKAQIAKSTINFDNAFMGNVKHDEALLVHIGIPVKGLDSDRQFNFNDIIGSFENVRVTFNDEEKN